MFCLLTHLSIRGKAAFRGIPKLQGTFGGLGTSTWEVNVH